MAKKNQGSVLVILLVLSLLIGILATVYFFKNNGNDCGGFMGITCSFGFSCKIIGGDAGQCQNILFPISTQSNELTPEVAKKILPLPDPTLNWKIYNSNGLFFKYPPEAGLTQAERIKNEFNEGGTEINITYIRPGYNRQQTDISDGYVFNITWGEVIGTGTAKEVSQTKYSQLKDGNVFPELTNPTETEIANRVAYCMESGPVFYSKMCYVDNDHIVFELNRTSSSNDIQQKQNYDMVLDQILSTFKFL